MPGLCSDNESAYCWRRFVCDSHTFIWSLRTYFSYGDWNSATDRCFDSLNHWWMNLWNRKYHLFWRGCELWQHNESTSGKLLTADGYKLRSLNSFRSKIFQKYTVPRARDWENVYWTHAYGTDTTRHVLLYQWKTHFNQQRRRTCSKRYYSEAIHEILWIINGKHVKDIVKMVIEIQYQNTIHPIQENRKHRKSFHWKNILILKIRTKN